MNAIKWAALVVLSLFATVAAAQYPNRPLRIVSPFAAGGGSDTITRVIAQRISEDTGKATVVENRTGAGGRIGYDFVAKAAPDGYTFAVTDATYTMMPALFASLPWDHANDLVPVATMAQTPFVIMARPGLKIATLAELVAFAKANPGKLNYGSAGNGSVNHIVTELFVREAGIELTHVPYKGMGDAMTGMLTETVDVLIHSVPGGAPSINSGKAVGLAVTSARRSPALPNVPSASEAGMPRMIAGNWFGLTAPKGTPKEAIDWMNGAVAKALATAAVRERLQAQGAEPMASTPAEFGALLQSDGQRWGSIIRAANIKSE